MTATQLLQLQKDEGASPRLIAHHEVVGEVAQELASKLVDLDLNLETSQIIPMAVIHDIGKIKVPIELSEAGKEHEQAGYEFAKDLGIPEHLAEICIFHGSEAFESFSIEILIVILADKLWKGKRVEALESHICKFVAKQTSQDYWSVFIDLDATFESIAEKGHERLIAMPALN